MVQQKKRRKLFVFRKEFLLSLVFILSFLILFILIVFFIVKDKNSICGDGTLDGKCSSREPYFCDKGVLIEKASICGCSELLSEDGDSCKSDYQFGAKMVSLEYVLRGERKEINFTVYKGLVDYISDLPAIILYNGDEQPSRRDFKLKKINEEQQRELLLPLVTKIQNLAKKKEDQARIAVSLVQNIPYGGSDKNIVIRSNPINYSRYPYEVLYDKKGVCEGKSELLAFLLNEIGYGVSLFYYPLENHELVGIQCPIKYSLNGTGYCFTETTGPSIISNSQEYYLGWGRLRSEPEIIFISGGNSLPKNLYEYQDAKNFVWLGDIVREEGELNFFLDLFLDHLKKKYGLEHI